MQKPGSDEVIHKDGFNFMGMGATWGETDTNIDESQTYYINVPESAGARMLRIFEENPKLIYYMIGGFATIGFIFLVYKKKKRAKK